MTIPTGEAGSVTYWLAQLRLGHATAAQKLWERYYEQLVRLAQKRMSGLPRGVEDEEDVAQSAFATFCGSIAKGRFPQLQDRYDLWHLLVVITARKAASSARRESSQKRRGTKTRVMQNFPSSQLEQIVGDEPSPDFALEAAETVRDLLNSLPTSVLRTIVLSKLEGYTNDEIAHRVGCSLRTIERRLQVIRELWQNKGN